MIILQLKYGLIDIIVPMLGTTNKGNFIEFDSCV